MGKKDEIITELNKLRQAGGKRDWVRNECLANSDAYAKTDHTKEYVLFNAEDDDIDIRILPGVAQSHADLYGTFILNSQAKRVRFPFNTGDSVMRSSLSPESYTDFKGKKVNNITASGSLALKMQNEYKSKYQYDYKSLIRWSTASRSCVVAIPLNGTLETAANCTVQKRPNDGGFCVPQTELEIAQENTGKRFCDTVTFTGGNCITINGVGYKLYSLKTGISYIGNSSQEFGKNVLEANAAFAMTRSQAIASVQKKADARDNTWIIQKELFTITSRCELSQDSRARDGFQVRDLSDLDFLNEDYLPGQAIPYTGTAFSSAVTDPDSDLAFWKRNFAYPCGRAKARLFLEYGLMQTSVNAQNFVIAFGKPNQSGGGTQIRRFILRDIGDSFWHNRYVESILGKQSGCYPLYTDELGKPELAHTLTTSSSASFPAPLMLRYGPGVVINGHGFGSQLKALRGWSDRHLLQLGQEITDGFLSYIREVGLLDQELVNVNGTFKPKQTKKHELSAIIAMGKLFQYSGQPIRYGEKDITKLREDTDWASLEAFQTLRKVLLDNVAGLVTPDDILWAHTAEEICLCLALENSIFNSTAKQQTLKRLLENQNRLPDVVNYPRQ